MSIQDYVSNLSSKICGLCEENQSKYCCPKCEVLYCSLDCYKSDKHLECSENFYRECVNQELSSLHVDDESKEKMIDILKRMQSADKDLEFDKLFENIENHDDEIAEEVDSDDEEGLTLHERLKDLNLDDADALWNALNEDERNEFEAILNQGDIGTILPQWEPWWMTSKKKKIIEDVDEINVLDEELKQCPEIKMAPKLSSLTTVQPSPAIKSNIMNVLASYVFVMRYFNGDIDPVEGTSYLLSICAALDGNANFDDPAIAVESVVQECLQSNLIETDQVSLDIMKYDTFLLLQGPSEDNQMYYCKAAISHIYKILNDAKLIEKNATNKQSIATSNDSEANKNFSKKFPTHNKEHFPKLDMSKVKKCLKKLEYYLSYVESFGMVFE